MELVLPILSALLIAAGLGIAAVAWLGRAESAAPTRVTSWDVSGALWFLGCGAAILGEAEAILPLVEEVNLRR